MYSFGELEVLQYLYIILQYVHFSWLLDIFIVYRYVNVVMTTIKAGYYSLIPEIVLKFVIVNNNEGGYHLLQLYF